MKRELMTSSSSAQAAGILYRTILRPGTVQAFYDHIKPPELSAVATRYHERISEGGAAAILEAKYADCDRIVDFARYELGHLAELSPYDDDQSPLFRAVAGSVEDFLEQLALKLSPPLAVIGTAAGDAPQPGLIAIVPPEARALIERVLAAKNLDPGWDIRSLSSDIRRIHLLCERGELPLDAIAIAGRPSGETP